MSPHVNPLLDVEKGKSEDSSKHSQTICYLAAVILAILVLIVVIVVLTMMVASKEIQF